MRIKINHTPTHYQIIPRKMYGFDITLSKLAANISIMPIIKKVDGQYIGGRR